MVPRFRSRTCKRPQRMLKYLLLSLLVAVYADIPSRTRRKVYFGSMDALSRTPDLRRPPRSCAPLVSLASSRGTRRHMDEEDQVTRSEKNRFWPPWPFSLIGNGGKDKVSKPASVDDNYQSGAALFWTYFKVRSRIGVRQLQQVGSELWFHLPPATPPLVILAALPQKNSVPALFSNPFVRKFVLASLGIAILSWGHSEINRKRLLVPLPIPPQYQDITKAFLPPFLPEVVESPVVLDDIVVKNAPKEDTKKQDDKKDQEEEPLQGLSPRIRKHLQSFYNAAPRPHTLGATLREWRQLKRVRRIEEERVRRQTIFDELVALQALKKQTRSKKTRKNSNSWSNMYTTTKASVEPLGYALVTGASRGIGRAIAVELARWEIPLILVARDVDRLTSLANDIERCYGVKCCVLPADLSKPDAAKRIHEATKDAGLKVDVLVNNAGLSSFGLLVDMDSRKLDEIYQVNICSVASLSHLYGRDMKAQGRGRILMVSSVVGAVYAGPTVAAYAATKSFEKVLGSSMARELEPYGVGITCMMPGAVRDSYFRHNSGTSEALCWKLPFYAKSAQKVAEQGVQAMLAGDVEIVPGVQNRILIKVLKPVIPQRIITDIVEMAWNPPRFSLPSFRVNKRRPAAATHASPEVDESSSPPTMETLWPGYAPKPSPTVLKMKESSKEEDRSQESTSDEIAILSSGTDSKADEQPDDSEAPIAESEAGEAAIDPGTGTPVDDVPIDEEGDAEQESTAAGEEEDSDAKYGTSSGLGMETPSHLSE